MQQKKSPLPLIDANPNKKKVPLHSKEALVKLLRWNFGYADFRGSQLEAIQAVLSGAIYLFIYRFHRDLDEKEFLIFSLIFGGVFGSAITKHGYGRT